MYGIGRLIFMMLAIYLMQIVIVNILGLIGIGGLASVIILEFIMAVVFAYIYYPAPYRKDALKDPKFHMSICIFFVLFMVFQFIF